MLLYFVLCQSILSLQFRINRWIIALTRTRGGFWFKSLLIFKAFWVHFSQTWSFSPVNFTRLLDRTGRGKELSAAWILWNNDGMDRPHINRDSSFNNSCILYCCLHASSTVFFRGTILWLAHVKKEQNAIALLISAAMEMIQVSPMKF